MDQLQADLEVVQQPIPFKIFSGLLRAVRSPDGKMRLHGVASSTVRDRHGDTMERTAIDDMHRAANDNLTIFLNHSYDVPEDVAGSVEKADIFERGADNADNPIWDLDFDVLVNQTNPRAVKAFEAIEGGTKLGLSIGAMIPEGGATRNKKTGAYSFKHVDLLETSIVGIPANPRSWVQNAIKALKSQASVPLGTPTLTLDGDRYKIEGSLEGTQINIANHAEPDDEPSADDAPAGPPPEGDHQTPQPQPVEKTPDDVPPQPQAVPGPDEPEVQDAKIQVITIDTDQPSGGSGGSQDAPAGSDPDTESDDDAYDSAPSADVSLASTLTESLASLEATASALVEVQRQLEAVTEERDDARRERDEVAAMAMQVITETSQIIEKLANMPVGRKAVLREVKDDLSGLERLYSPGILKLLRKDDTSNG